MICVRTKNACIWEKELVNPGALYPDKLDVSLLVIIMWVNMDVNIAINYPPETQRMTHGVASRKSMCGMYIII